MTPFNLSGLRCRPRFVTVLVALLASVVSGCSEPGPVEVEVRTVGFDAATRSPVVVLQELSGGGTLPIWIGAAEAQAIAMEVEGVRAPRPMTHDLLKSALEGAGVGLDKVVIEALEDRTYFARVFLSSMRKDFELDSRPSDAIALAVRFERPIFVRRSLMMGETVAAVHMPSDDVATVGDVTVQNLTRSLAEYFGVEEGGVVVTDAPTDRVGGLRRGDIIVEVEGDPLPSARAFARRTAHAGRAVELSVYRHDSEIVLQFEP